jgi:hypothetical protein
MFSVVITDASILSLRCVGNYLNLPLLPSLHLLSI